MIYFSVIHLLLVEQWYALSLPLPFPCSLWIRTCLSLDWICKVNSCLCAFVCSIEFLCHFFFLPPDYFLLSLLTIIQNVRMQPHTCPHIHTRTISWTFLLWILSVEYIWKSRGEDWAFRYAKKGPGLIGIANMDKKKFLSFLLLTQEQSTIYPI